MSKDPIIEDAVSIVPVADVHRTVAFYADVLGFEARLVTEDASFAIAVHGEAAIHFVHTDSAEVLKATANNISIYIWVRNIDALFTQLQPKLATLPDGRVRPPFDQPYGMREFHVKDPDGCLLLFGENLQDG
ncbi:MAG: VOC family protein [Pseudomonadota bacterium]